MSSKPPNAEKQLAGFIGKFAPKHQALLRAVRKAMRKRFASIPPTFWNGRK